MSENTLPTPALTPEVAPAPAATPDASQAKKPVRLHCPKHGDITNASLYLTFKSPDGTSTRQFLYCLDCLNEILLKFQAEGSIQKVQVLIDGPTDPAAAKALTEAVAQNTAEKPAENKVPV